MSAITICLSIALCLILIINIECAVIKVQEIPLGKGVVMKIVLKEDKDGDTVATIKIAMEEKKKHGKDLLPQLINKLVKPDSDFIPDLGSRHGIVNGNCPKGKVKIGPLCSAL